MNPNTVLIVEDIEDTLKWLSSVVNEVFPQSTQIIAMNLADARSQQSEMNPDLILLDLGLPDGSGLELIREIGNQENPYIVVTTIFDDDENLREALRLGASGYLLKDDDRDDLTQNLRSLIQDRPPFSTRTLQKMMGEFQSEDADSTLTAREEDVLRLIAKGYKVGDTAEMLGLTANTVKGYLKTIYAKLNISSRAEATAEAIRRKLVNP